MVFPISHFCTSNYIHYLFYVVVKSKDHKFLCTNVSEKYNWFIYLNSNVMTKGWTYHKIIILGSLYEQENKPQSKQYIINFNCCTELLENRPTISSFVDFQMKT